MLCFVCKMHYVFSIHLSEVENETKENEFIAKGVKVLLDDCKDVFPKELNELPPMREVAHAIDLIADAAPIAKVP